jgi:hypothetical protein
MIHCPYPGCPFVGTDEQVDDHRVAGHRSHPYVYTMEGHLIPRNLAGSRYQDGHVEGDGE